MDNTSEKTEEYECEFGTQRTPIFGITFLTYYFDISYYNYYLSSHFFKNLFYLNNGKKLRVKYLF